MISANSDFADYGGAQLLRESQLPLQQSEPVVHAKLLRLFWQPVGLSSRIGRSVALAQKPLPTA
jgi:hypothetical protein